MTRFVALSEILASKRFAVIGLGPQIPLLSADSSLILKFDDISHKSSPKKWTGRDFLERVFPCQ